MKFQPLILPVLLWTLILAFLIAVPPRQPILIGLFIVLVFCATLLSSRLLIKKSHALVCACCVGVFFLISWLAGFTFLNSALIFAIGILVCVFL